ncbi:hypothetical protein K439DRAFT_1087739 [Ramaria rubella]|nr:hypothetical protein K439DRAFT_1087739 [Ramaria rubella]
MTLQAPLKVSLLFLAALAQHVGFKPPHPPPVKDDKVNKETFFEKNTRWMGFINQYSMITYCMTESVVLLILYLGYRRSPGTLLSTLCPGPTSLTALSTISNSFLLGVGAMSIGVVIRVWCYKALGTLFTYEITIRRDHKLITSGPYNYVRHPGYTACLFLIVGAAIIGCNPHSYIRECEVMLTSARWIIGAWAPFQTYVIVSLLRRGKVEDEGLRATFGKTWDEYSRRVPCRFIPGLV